MTVLRRSCTTQLVMTMASRRGSEPRQRERTCIPLQQPGKSVAYARQPPDSSAGLLPLHHRGYAFCQLCALEPR